MNTLMKKWKKICYGCLPFPVAFALMYMLTFLFLMGSVAVWCIFHFEQISADGNAASNLLLNEEWLKEMQVLGNCFVYLVFCFVFAIWYKRAFLTGEKKQCGKRKGFSVSGLLGAVAFGISIQCLCSYALNLLLPLFPKVQKDYMALMDSMGTGQGFFPLIYMGILAPVAEELIFRGLILGYEKRELPFWCANFIQAFFFGVYHQNVVQFVYAFFIGILLGCLRHRQQSLKTVMLIHGIINITGNLLAFFKLDVLMERKSYMFMGIAVSLTAAIVSYLYLRKRKQ